MRSKNGAIGKDPGILGGTPAFRGKRVRVQTMFDYIEGGESLRNSSPEFRRSAKK